ncbi:MAG: Uma2 family endonuclease, partial [Butyrivibrio sp.]|nr:Uma2 family endonuclease [Butyrivibrio sp.]
YERAGVKEYWIIDPQKKAVLVYNLEQGWTPTTYSFEDCVPSAIVKELTIDFAKLVEEWDNI